MQEDSFYSKYLENKTGSTKRKPTTQSVELLRKELVETKSSLTQLIEGVRESIEQTDFVQSEENGGAESTLLKFLARQENVSTLSVWSSLTVALNANLNDFDLISGRLRDLNVPVHETFGDGASTPGHLQVGFGKGFKLEHMKLVLEALQPTGSWLVSFLDYDEDPGEYDNMALIGAYGFKEGIPIGKALRFAGLDSANTEAFYKKIGR